MAELKWLWAHVLITLCVSTIGPCTEANNGTELVASLADCDEDGNYVPLQCRMNSSTGEYSCQCVYLNGTAVSDTEVDNLEEAPDCNDIGQNVHVQCQLSKMHD